MALSSYENVIEVIDDEGSDHQILEVVADPVVEVLKTVKSSHPFFMTRSEKLKALTPLALAQTKPLSSSKTTTTTASLPISSLSSQIAASNALNRSIQVNLITSGEECEYSAAATSSGSEEEEDQQQHRQKHRSTVQTNCFFKKRAKHDLSIFTTSQEDVELSSFTRRLVNLKNIFTNPPPFPQSYQIIDNINRNHDADLNRNQIQNAYKFDSLQSHSIMDIDKESNVDVNTDVITDTRRRRVLISQLFTHEEVEETEEERDKEKTHPFPHIPSLFFSHQTRLSYLLSSLLSDIESSDSDGHGQGPCVHVLLGPPGIGKTFLACSVASALNRELIEINSTSVRNGKVFETLNTTLSHTTKSFSTFFTKEKVKVTDQSAKHVILFDEVEIAFESDRGFWSSLSQFLASLSSSGTTGVRCPLIFITSNTSELFLKSILKFPELTKFIDLPSLMSNSIVDAQKPLKSYDYRQFLNNSNFIKRLHRIDSNFDFEYFSLLTGMKRKLDFEDFNSDPITQQCKPENILQVIHDWPDVETVHIPLTLSSLFTDEKNSNSALVDSLEFSSLTDLIFTSATFYSYTSRSSLKIYSPTIDSDVSWTDGSGLGYYDHLYDSNNYSDTDVSKAQDKEKDLGLLFSSIPDVYESKNNLSSAICKELIERTIFPQIVQRPSKSHHSSFYINDCESWKDLSKRLLKRFSIYSPSLNSHSIWSQHLTQHILLIESHNYKHSFTADSRRCASAYKRKRKPVFRFINDDLIESLLNFDK